MSLDTPPKITKRRQLAFALETTTGTAATITAANSVMPVSNAALKFETETVERETDGDMAPSRQARGARSASSEFMTELQGNGASGQADWTKLLLMCGIQVNAGVYTPISGAAQTGTLALYQSGRLKTMAGAMGTFVLSIRRGQPAKFKWTFSGIYAGIVDAAIITPAKVGTIAPRVGGAFTIGGTTYRTDNVDFELGNTVVLREDITASTGYRAAFITDRAPRIKLATEALPLSSKDWYDFYHSSATAAMSIVIGPGADNNSWTLAAPVMELAKLPEDGDRGGMLTDVLEFIPLGNSDAGDDEWSLTGT
jgi:hypothetical protein